MIIIIMMIIMIIIINVCMRASSCVCKCRYLCHMDGVEDWCAVWGLSSGLHSRHPHLAGLSPSGLMVLNVQGKVLVLLSLKGLYKLTFLVAVVL